MTKKFLIDGMSCNHCKLRVEKALSKFGKVSVDLDLNTAALELKGDAADAELKAAIEDIGFEVVSIS